MKKLFLSLLTFAVAGIASAQYGDAGALGRIGKEINLADVRSDYNSCDCYVMDTTFILGLDSATGKKATVKRGGALRAYSNVGTRGKHINAGADKGWTVSGNKITLTKSCYYLPGLVHFDTGVILNIPAGTKFYGSKSTFSAFIQLPGSQVFAKGTAAAPITFTSAMSTRARGDWGGVVIAGYAPIAGEVSSFTSNISRSGNTSYIEGLSQKAPYLVGGTRENDNSGLWSWVQVDYAGLNVGATGSGNELNSFSLYGVGKATKMNNLQVTWANDDAIEIFGGSVNVQNMFILNTLDDDIDLDGGYQGTIQNVLVYRLDTASRDVSRSRLAEISNKNTNHPRKTMPVITNVTAFGARAIVGKSYVFKGASTNERSMTGFSIDKNASARIYNSILHGYDQALYIDDQATANNLDSAWGPQFAYNVWNNCVADMTVGSSVTYFNSANAFPKDNKDNWVRYFQASNFKGNTDAMKNIGYNVTVGQATYPTISTLTIYSTYAKEYGNLASALVKSGSGFGSNDTLDRYVTLKSILNVANRGISASKLTGFTTDATTDFCSGSTPFGGVNHSDKSMSGSKFDSNVLQLFAINPSEGEINVEIQEADAAQLSNINVYDLSGKLVKSLTASGNNVNVTDMPVGLYTVVVNTNNMQQSIKVVVK